MQLDALIFYAYGTLLDVQTDKPRTRSTSMPSRNTCSGHSPTCCP